MKKWMAADGAFVAGLGALILRRQLYITAVDEKGLLLRMHPLSFVLMGLTAAVLVLILWSVRKTTGAEDPCTTGAAAALGHTAMALGILATVLPGVPTAGTLSIAWRWLGLAAPLCLLAAGAAAATGKKPFFLLHVLPCLFFLVHIVNQNQSWSSNPQVQDYLFALLGAAALMFFCFYTAAAEAGCGNRQLRLSMALAAVYLCLAELANSTCPALYFAGAIWTRTELLRLRAADSRTEG